MPITIIYNISVGMNKGVWQKKLSNFLKIRYAKVQAKTTLTKIALVSYSGFFAYYLYRLEDSQRLINTSLCKTTQFASQITIPTMLRKHVYGAYARKYGVNLDELQRPLHQFKTFDQFFTRKVKPRPQFEREFTNLTTLCCPCDAEILNISKVQNNQNLIVKDVEYSLNDLLFSKPVVEKKLDYSQLRKKQGTDLYQIIFYLCPGDYHRFHSPSNIQVRLYNEIPGHARPVNLASLLKNGGKVYQQNGRKILHCTYVSQPSNARLYLGLVMVGALNVSSIYLEDKPAYSKGDEIGYFKLGSTVVLLVEAPAGTKWQKKVGDKVRFGETLCSFQ